MNESELSKLRGVIGSLQFAVTHTRPDMAAKLGEVQVQISKAVLREAQETSDVRLCFHSIPTDQLTHVSFGDA